MGLSVETTAAFAAPPRRNSAPAVWLEEIAWEPLLRLVTRSLGARAGWLRVGEEFRSIVVDGDLAPAAVRWMSVLSRSAAFTEISEEQSGDHSALAIPLGHEVGMAAGSLGVLFVSEENDAHRLSLAAARSILEDAALTIRTELALARDALSNADALHNLHILGKAVANMQLGVTVTDASGRIVFTNPAEARMHGYEPEELIGKPAHILAPPKLRRRIHIDENRRDTSWTRESTNRHRDGRDFPVLLWSDVIEDAEGGFCGVVTCAEDLTQRREVEAALRRSESMFRAIFDNAPVGLALIGEDSWIIRANPRLCGMIGIDGRTIAEARLEDFVHPEDAVGVRHFYSMALTDGGEVRRHEHRIRTPGGNAIWINATISPIHAADGSGQLWIALIEDVTKRRVLEEQLRHSQKMEAVGRLAGGVAHDFNNVLTAIRGISELLLMESAPDHPMADDIREIHRAAETASQLTRQLLAFSRRQPTKFQIQDLNAVLADGEKMFRRLMGDAIELEIDLDPELSPILGDAAQLEQVALNLIVNARDATPPGGRVRVTTRNISIRQDTETPTPPARFVELVVEDSGCGIEPDALECIFDPFYTTKPKGAGTGLGLSIVYGIVTRTGGQIEVDSEVGRGTVFRVRLPIASLVTDLALDGLAEPSRTILVLQAEEGRCALTRGLLENAGFTVLAPESVGEAERLAETYGDRIHVLLVDESIDGSSGLHIARSLRGLREDMRAIVMTDDRPPHPDLEDGVETIHKFADPEEMLETIRRQIETIPCFR